MSNQETIVCVTGASGFVASHCVQQLLQKGYTVHATVRNPDDDAKVAFLKKIAADAEASERFHLFAAELLEKGSFDKAMNDAKFVLHTASPFFIRSKSDPTTTFIAPAVEGTVNVLNSVNRTESVSRVVLTSSVAAVYGNACDKTTPFTEDDWNRTSTLSEGAYSLSKRMAEEKAWEMVKAQERYDLVTINPALVIGPTLSGRSTASYDFVHSITGGETRSGCPELYMGVVDVRDVAKAHIEAMEQPQAKGRYIVAPETYKMMEFAKILKEKYPDFQYPRRTAPKWMLYFAAPFLGLSWTFVSRNIGHAMSFDCSKIKKELNFEFRCCKQALLDMVEAGLAYNILP